MYAVWPRRQHFSNLDEEEIQPIAAKVKGQRWIHTRRSCPRWNINPLSPTQGAPHHWQPLQSADGFLGRGLPVPGRRVRLPSWPEAPPVVSDTEARPLITAKPTAEGEAPRADAINFSSAAPTSGFNSCHGVLRPATAALFKKHSHGFSPVGGFDWLSSRLSCCLVFWQVNWLTGISALCLFSSHSSCFFVVLCLWIYPVSFLYTTWLNHWIGCGKVPEWSSKLILVTNVAVVPQCTVPPVTIKFGKNNYSVVVLL